jgi:predicted nucleic acid-binding protein
MSHLLDVNLLAACAWQSHARHREANRRLQNLTRFATCPVGQMGFLRVSMSPAYGASFADARQALADILALPTHQFLADDTTAAALPALARHPGPPAWPSIRSGSRRRFGLGLPGELARAWAARKRQLRDAA